jgi:hypothetical protein
MKTPNGYDQINALFGIPYNADGTLNKAWEHANIITVPAPPGWKLYYQNSPTSVVPIAGITMHRLLEGVFITVLNEIWDYAKKQAGDTATDADVRNWLHQYRLDITGGGFNFRKSSGDPTKLSLHSYGIAIDWDPLHNPHQKPLIRTLPDWWYAIWANNGWSDGRHFNTPDPMHVQFATGA